MHAITANELKTRGVIALEDGLQDESEAMITVRGKKPVCSDACGALPLFA